MKITEKGVIVRGYKATDENLKCRGFQFEIGKWYEHEGDIELCNSGFHFCEYPSGPWSYYSTGRLFEVEAELVVKSEGPGSDLKHVSKRIRLVKEIATEGDCNTGNRNTGNWNTGNWNTGDGNVGNYHSGFFCSGDPAFYIFDKKANKDDVDFGLVEELCIRFSQDEEFDPSPFLSIPNATKNNIKKLHKAHIEARRRKNG